MEMDYRRVLILCTGNICRSPMAEAILRARLTALKPDALVESAGIGAPVGKPADPVAVDLMAARGLDISEHRARQISGDMIREFPLLIVMEAMQQEYIEKRWPLSRGRVHTLGRWGGFEIPDPYRGDYADFEKALVLIDRGIDDWFEKIWD